jgi:glutamate-1-semialdehyde 2,1-aminomutase
VARAAGDGLSFGAPGRAEVEYAERLGAALDPLTMVRFTCSGAEAVTVAVRLARAHTGRRLLVTFDGGYHGHGDAVVTSPDRLVLPFDDEAALDVAFRAHGDDIAAVLVEAVPANEGLLPQRRAWWARLEARLRGAGALLVVDEVITGFRLRFGAWHPALGVGADLVTLGKVVGGGMPLAAVAGRPSLMRLLAPAGPVFHAGTMAAHPVAVAAGHAAIEALDRPDTWDRLDALTAAFVAASPLRWRRVGSLAWPWLGDDDPPTAKPAWDAVIAGRFADLHAHALAAGVYLPPAAGEVCFVSLAHPEAELVAAANAMGGGS